MESYIVEWINLLARFAHVITGIAWIGASFYFVWLDNHLQPPKREADIEQGVGGEVWSVHGGGFYHAQKYTIAPPELPETLHWFKWEAYTTFMTGVFLLALMYWYQAEIYLIDPSVMDIGKPIAVSLGMLTIAGGWFAYDLLCKSALGKNDAALAAIMFVLLTITAYVLCQVFSGRGAYMHFGAMLGTIMVANVFFVIMPGQRDLVAAKKEGRAPEAIHGIKAKQRSVHNTYFTLPVLFVMISNHYAMTYAHEYNWLILIGLSVAGALIRIFFVQRHKGQASPITLVVAALLIIAIIWLIRPDIKPIPHNASSADSSSALPLLSKAELNSLAHEIVINRCVSCHAETPAHPGFMAAPKGILLETPEQMIQHAQSVYQQTVVTKAMPIGNLTGITNEERSRLGEWFTGSAWLP